MDPSHDKPAVGASVSSPTVYTAEEWAVDPATGKLVPNSENSYAIQSTIAWKKIIGVLRGLGLTFKDVASCTVNYREFNDQNVHDAFDGMVNVMPDDWIGDVVSLWFKVNQDVDFKREGVVYTVKIVTTEQF